ncbi:glycosyltransferase family 4 protein [Flavobacterium sp. CBA20B-1]|uniref:glycosyltransferase family 4 protein n=1 Tax=unclassified Flavobacterium TaxID=196869 RepID=UPI00222556CA|nr:MULTISPECIES: glycosyltransferase family 4 protein [unclassified Flavobacterium]WCM42252.1 glycosyltransferase family 4 protein [Flavobacterium sp. CBA20B-1]
MKTLLMVCNTDWFFISHRLCIAQEAIEEGWEVLVACEDTGRAAEIAVDGIKYIDFKFSRSGTNPITELNTLKQFYALYKSVKPDVVHHITLKPVTYGSIAAKILKIKGVVNAVSGLGYNFTGSRKGLVQKMMVKLMKYGFNRDNLTVIFQNGDDQKALEELKIISSKNKIQRIKGSGVDLNKFAHSPFPGFDPIKVLLPSRMLWDKGVKELKEASDLLKEKYKVKLQFILSGLADEDNKAGVSAEYLNNWQDEEYVKWIGYQKDMVQVYQDSHIVVLPSYREGMPKTLIEACAIGRAIITTYAIGCRECVDEGINGLKVPVYSVVELAQAIEKLVLNPKLIESMGNESRLKAEREFDVNSVVKKHLEIYSNVLN